MATKQKKRSKSKKFWKYGSETHEQRLARLSASKDHSRRRRLQAKNAPLSGKELSRVVQYQLSQARKAFESWLASPEVIKAAAHGGVSFYLGVSSALEELVPVKGEGQ